MHILEQYAINCGAKISKPSIITEYFPLPEGKYICLHAGSGMESKNYDFFEEVINLMNPHLVQEGIKIIQIGGEKERIIRGCYPALGSSKKQMAYIISNSELYFGNDTMSLHFASHFQKKIVCVSTVLYTSNFYPYWSNKEDYVILESHRNGNKPTFSAYENPKTINFIPPEQIAENILNLLKIKNKLNSIKTIHLGQSYHQRIFNVVPNHLVQQNELVNNINIRMDLMHNEKVLSKQLDLSKCIITCNRPIDINILKQKSSNIFGVNCFIEDLENLQFIKELKAANIKYQMYSYLEEDELRKYKTEYMDYGLIQNISIKHDEIKQTIKNNSSNSTFYKSNSFILSDGKVFLSEKAFFDNKPVSSINENTQEFYNEKILNEDPEKFYIFNLDLT